MKTNPTCDEDSRHSNAERYAACRMTAGEAEQFEDHFVACAECQNEVRFASAIVTGLPPRPPMAHSQPVGSKPVRTRFWRGAAGLAMAAGLAGVLLLRQGPRPAVLALGGVAEPPTYLGIPVRDGGSQQDAVFEAAMIAYGKHEYAAAAAGLRSALAAGQDSVAAQFFLATSLLLDDRPSDAASEYERVLAHGDTPYRAESRYYRAKALLRLGRLADAKAELAHLARTDGVTFELGAALLDSLALLPQR